MKLYLLRHCEAVEGERMDPDRGLTAKGIEQAKAMKRFRKAAGIKWDFLEQFAERGSISDRQEEILERIYAEKTP